ncbi:putative esterase YheT [Porphyridium purpureum]|uniref:Putative esterase YheT n=1 Tax=Porphyridium purpureum TaxID=35688 RepID=A0A5J4YXV3_PORPP|nr:putative esterase YheT [Porphyridium purpureum]|eukprot:POR5593..scf209_3
MGWAEEMDWWRHSEGRLVSVDSLESLQGADASCASTSRSHVGAACVGDHGGYVITRGRQVGLHTWLQLAKLMSSRFTVPRFEPPFWASNNHMQTLLGFVFPIVTPLSVSWVYRRDKLLTADSDFFYVDSVGPLAHIQLQSGADANAAAEWSSPPSLPLVDGVDQLHKQLSQSLRNFGIELDIGASRFGLAPPQLQLTDVLAPPEGKMHIETLGSAKSTALCKDATQGSDTSTLGAADKTAEGVVANAATGDKQAREDGVPQQAAHETPAQTRTDVVVILVPGTESSSFGPYNIRLVDEIHRLGWTVKVLNWRGSGAGTDSAALQSPKMYHLGFTDDLDQLVRETSALLAHNAEPGAAVSIFLVGLSLGGNVVLKWLGEQGHEALRLGVRGAAVASVPFSPYHAARKLNEGMSRAIYAANFLRTLKPKALAIHQRFPDAFDIKAVLSAKNIYEWDEAVTAPMFGFESASDYYRRCNVNPLLKHIVVPVYCLQALDDPVMDPNYYPRAKDLGSAPIQFDLHALGGHLGFVTEGVLNGTQRVSFMTHALVRFLQHVDSCLHSAISNSFSLAIISRDHESLVGLRCLLPSASSSSLGYHTSHGSQSGGGSNGRLRRVLLRFGLVRA